MEERALNKANFYLRSLNRPMHSHILRFAHRITNTIKSCQFLLLFSSTRTACLGKQNWANDRFSIHLLISFLSDTIVCLPDGMQGKLGQNSALYT